MTEARNCASNVASALPSDAGIPKSVFGNCVLGSTGHWPVPSGDSPDGMGSASAANKDSLLLGSALLVPVGGSPTGTGGSPVLPIRQTRSKSPADLISIQGFAQGLLQHHPLLLRFRYL